MVVFVNYFCLQNLNSKTQGGGYLVEIHNRKKMQKKKKHLKTTTKVFNQL